MEKTLKKQDDSAAKNADVSRDGFSAEDLGQESASIDSTEIAQMMRRGNESVSDPNDRDIVGTSDAATDTENQPFPEHQSTKSNLIEKETKTRNDNPVGKTYPYSSTGEPRRGEE